MAANRSAAPGLGDQLRRRVGSEPRIARRGQAIGVGAFQRLGEEVDAGVGGHRRRVGVFDDVERLQHDQPLAGQPGLVDAMAAVEGLDRRFDHRFVGGQVALRQRAAHRLHPLGDAPRQVALVEGARPLAGQDAQGGGEVGLRQHIAPRRGRAAGQEDSGRAVVLLQHLGEGADRAGGGRVTGAPSASAMAASVAREKPKRPKRFSSAP